MKTYRFILTSAIGLFLVVILISCNLKKKESEQIETILPMVSKKEIENDAWQIEEKYWEYVQKIDTVAYKKLWHNDFHHNGMSNILCL